MSTIAAAERPLSTFPHSLPLVRNSPASCREHAPRTVYDVLVMRVFRHSESSEERILRRLRSAYANLVAVADDIDDPDDVDARADLVIAAEDLLDVTMHITELARNIAWQYSPVPESGESEL